MPISSLFSLNCFSERTMWQYFQSNFSLFVWFSLGWFDLLLCSGGYFLMLRGLWEFCGMPVSGTYKILSNANIHTHTCVRIKTTDRCTKLKMYECFLCGNYQNKSATSHPACTCFANCNGVQMHVLKVCLWCASFISFMRHPIDITIIFFVCLPPVLYRLRCASFFPFISLNF